MRTLRGSIEFPSLDRILIHLQNREIKWFSLYYTQLVDYPKQECLEINVNN